MDLGVILIIQLVLRIVGVIVCSNKAKELNRNSGGWGFFGFVSPIIAMIWINCLKPITIWDKDVSNDLYQNFDEPVYKSPTFKSTPHSTSIKPTSSASEKNNTTDWFFIILFIILVFGTIIYQFNQNSKKDGDIDFIPVDTVATVVDTTAVSIDTAAISADTIAVVADTAAVIVDTTAVSAIDFGQTSEFNKRTIFNQGHQDSWIKDKNGNEMRFRKPSILGYTNSINQMGEVLDFYNLNSEDIVHEESYFPDGTKFGEFSKMYSGLKSGNIYIEKEWRNDEVSVSWICNKDFYCISIKPL